MLINRSTPIPTPAGNLIPGAVMDITLTPQYGSKPRTLVGVTIDPNPGVSTLLPGGLAPITVTTQAGTTLAIRQADVSAVRLVRPPVRPVTGTVRSLDALGPMVPSGDKGVDNSAK